MGYKKVEVDSSDLKQLFLDNLKILCKDNKDLLYELYEEFVARLDNGYYDHEEVVYLYKEVVNLYDEKIKEEK